MIVSPAGKRGVISRSTKRVQAASLTLIRSPILRPNISSATCCGFPLRHSVVCACAFPITASPRSTAAYEQRLFTADAFNGGAAGGELVFEPLEAAIEMIDPVDHGLALGRQGSDNQRHRSAQVRRHHRRAFESVDALDRSGLTVELDAGAKAG